MNCKMVVKLTLLFAVAFLSVNSFAVCNGPTFTEAGFRTAPVGMDVSTWQAQVTGCNFYVTMIFFKVSNVSGSTATTFVVNEYDNLTGSTCSGTVKQSWTLTVGGTHGSSDVISMTIPGTGMPAGPQAYTCITVPSAPGFVSTVGFAGNFAN
jgi:hypothetical protein